MSSPRKAWNNTNLWSLTKVLQDRVLRKVTAVTPIRTPEIEPQIPGTDFMLSLTARETALSI
jgi:hypothetical protein